MQYSEVKKIITSLENSELTVDDLKDYRTNILKIIGWEFALKYKHCSDKDSQEAKQYLSLLIDIRILVKSKLNVQDVLMERYKTQAN